MRFRASAARAPRVRRRVVLAFARRIADFRLGRDRELRPPVRPGIEVDLAQRVRERGEW